MNIFARQALLPLCTALLWLPSPSCRAGDAAAGADAVALAVPAAPAAASRELDARLAQRFKRHWGVDIEGVRAVSSGYMLAFRYRVLDADKARLLNDRTVRPYLIDEATGIRMAVPAMEKVGELRQSTEPEVGRSYFIVFGNPGKTVAPGNRVSVVIGGFQVDGIVVK
ncbi:hypothetical protein [Noviherbaspirillum pedocola]|uniref:Transmembrane protein n=1 Tax=Noviherbaspirillum pedocola TaxID=2801341 RepID=A0A934SUJ4_9BURK|nr:hypothetical protein [Noviherbaspirillum pedocola]MBK4735829.1 hypothetical protein [Noviherbaspirillum pedocola]